MNEEGEKQVFIVLLLIFSSWLLFKTDTPGQRSGEQVSLRACVFNQTVKLNEKQY